MNFVPCSYTDIQLFHSLWHMHESFYSASDHKMIEDVNSFLQLLCYLLYIFCTSLFSNCNR